MKRARAGCTMKIFWSWMVVARTSTFTVQVLRLGGGRAGGHHLSVAQEPLASVSLGTGGRVWPAHMRHGLTRSRRRGCGMASDFGSGGSFGVGAVLCCGAHFFRARLAGVCLVVGPSFGWFEAPVLLPSPFFRATGSKFSGHGKVGENGVVFMKTCLVR